MIISRYYSNVTVAALKAALVIVVIGVLGCSGPRKVKEEHLKAIITETLVSDAFLQKERKNQGPTATGWGDSLDYYAPIYSKYGYTAADVRYTVSSMATRKSNPLSTILKDVVKEIDNINSIANYHYMAYLKFDTLAMDYYRDTVYQRDTLITGRLARYKIFIKEPRAGNYTINMNYNTMDGPNDYRRSKSVEYYVSRDNSVQQSLPVKSTHYIIRSRGKELPYSSSFSVPHSGADSLLISFNDQIPDAMFKDTSFVRDIVVSYTPTTAEARQDYYRARTGFSQILYDLYEQRFFKQPAADIIPVGVTVRR